MLKSPFRMFVTAVVTLILLPSVTYVAVEGRAPVWVKPVGVAGRQIASAIVDLPGWLFVLLGAGVVMIGVIWWALALRAWCLDTMRLARSSIPRPPRRDFVQDGNPIVAASPEVTPCRGCGGRMRANEAHTSQPYVDGQFHPECGPLAVFEEGYLKMAQPLRHVWKFRKLPKIRTDPRLRP